MIFKVRDTDYEDESYEEVEAYDAAEAARLYVEKYHADFDYTDNIDVYVKYSVNYTEIISTYNVTVQMEPQFYAEKL